MISYMLTMTEYSHHYCHLDEQEELVLYKALEPFKLEA